MARDLIHARTFSNKNLPLLFRTEFRSRSIYWALKSKLYSVPSPIYDNKRLKGAKEMPFKKCE